MLVRRGGTTDTYLLGQEIGAGGCGSVHLVPHVRDRVAKRLKSRSSANTKKIVAMADDCTRWGLLELPGRAVFTIPMKPLFDARTSEFVGYETIRIAGAVDLCNYYVPALRAKLPGGDDLIFRTRICVNAAYGCHALETRRYIFTDFHGKNLLVFPDGSVAFVDIDSCQFNDGQSVHLSGEWTEEFTSPELLGKPLTQVVRDPTSTWYSLMVGIFLMVGGDGQHPYPPNPHGRSAKMSQSERVKNSVWVHAQSANSPARRRVTPLHQLHPILRDLFVQCFVYGQHVPTARPSAITIATRLEQLLRELTRARLVRIPALPGYVINQPVNPMPAAAPALAPAAPPLPAAALACQQPHPIGRRTAVRCAVVLATCAVTLAFVLGRWWEKEQRAGGDPTPVIWRKLAGGR